LHHTSLIATIVAGLGLAFVFGAIANRLKLPVLVGYLVAGVSSARSPPATWPIRSWRRSWPRSG
jgi:predicted Kef-type K+ transport protein